MRWIHSNHQGSDFLTPSHSKVSQIECLLFLDVCKYTDIPLPSSNVDQVIVKSNGIFFAVPVSGPTGQLYVRPVVGTERYTHKALKLSCHKYLHFGFIFFRYAISSFAFDPFNKNLMMTGAEDGEISVFLIL